MMTISSKLPAPLRMVLRRLRDSLKEAPYLGKGRFCPVCERASRRFRPFGIPPREGAQCVHCQALERHRILWLFLSQKTDFFNGVAKRMLHVAPEQFLESRFRKSIGEGYLTADLLNPRAMVQMDITNIQYPDQSFDVIYCSHVLEHVQDDHKAMREFHRVLKDSGWAILLVPITAKETFEDPSITEPEDRLRVFGQEDHVRNYGPDYVDRLRRAGFHVEVTEIDDLADCDEAQKMGLNSAGGKIYYCTVQPEQ